MDITEATKKACEEPTLVDALTWICVWEGERAIKQARENFGSGANGSGWDTCFKICLQAVMNVYSQPSPLWIAWDCGEGAAVHLFYEYRPKRSIGFPECWLGRYTEVEFDLRPIAESLNMRPGDCVEIELKRKEK